MISASAAPLTRATPSLTTTLASGGPRVLLADWLLPALALLVPLAFWPSLGQIFQIPKLALLELGLFAALLALAFGGTVDRDLLRLPAAKAALAFLAINALAVLASVAPGTAFVGLRGHNEGLLSLLIYSGYFFVAACWLRDEQRLARFSAALTAAGGLTSLLAIAQQLGFDPFGWAAGVVDQRRTVGTIGHPNSLAELLVLTMPFAAWLAWRGRGLWRDVAIWTLALEVGALFLTQARTAWATVGLELLVLLPLLFCLRRRALRPFGPALAIVPHLIALGAFATLLLMPISAQQIESAVSNVVNRGNPLVTRQYLWHSGLEALRDRPLLGWGPGLVELVYPAYRSTGLDAYDDSVGGDDDYHNVLLNVGVGAGLPGLAAYAALQLAVLFLLFRRLFAGSDQRGSDAAAGTAAALALLFVWTSCFVLFMFGKSQVTAHWLTWLVAGAVVGMFGSSSVGWRPLPRPAGLLAGALALLLLLDAGSRFGADAAYGRAIDLEQEAPGRGLASYRLAAQLRPFDPSYQHELAAALGREAEANDDPALYRESFERTERASALLSHRDAYILAELGRTLLALEAQTAQSGDTPLAHAERAIALDPRNPILRADAAELAFELGRPELARQHWEAARERARSSDAFERLGRVALALGDLDAARAAFRQGAHRAWRPGQARDLLVAWGDAAILAGAFDEAISAYREALARDPDDTATRIKLAEALAASGRRDEAIREARLALDPTAAGERAEALIEQLSRP